MSVLVTGLAVAPEASVSLADEQRDVDALHAADAVEGALSKRVSTVSAALEQAVFKSQEPEDTVELPDFNLRPLNGEETSDILSRYGVHVKVLGPRDPHIAAYPIIVAGNFKNVATYVRHLRSTWPTEAVS